MKREILFKGKRVDNGEWVYGDLLKSYRLYVYDGKRFCEVIPETIGQFTGLTDSEGERIFEDDIIKIVEDGDKKTDNRPEYFNYGDVALILFDSRYCQFGAYNNSIDEIESIGNLVRAPWFNFIEVIGNIHDNPELLK